MNLVVYDIIFLVLFLAFVSFFLLTKKKNLKKEGLLYLYRTRWGIKLINRIGNKYQKTLKILSYLSVGCGYLLMIGVFYLVYTIVKIYLFVPSAVRAIKVPPIMPLVPYLPQVLKLEFLPPFYFTYWIVIIAIVAITHEMAHGIFAAYNKIKIKKTGFGFFPFFLPIFLAAFVELDEKIMSKRKNFAQRAVLSAGTFANILTAILFFGILVLFFFLSFSASGVIYDSYAVSAISIAGITSINNIPINNPTYTEFVGLLDNEGMNNLSVGNQSYFVTKGFIEIQNKEDGLFVYDSAPAIKANLSSIITEINGVRIYNTNVLAEELAKYSPGEEIIVKTVYEEGLVENRILLEENPGSPGKAWLGVAFLSQEGSGFLGKIVDTFSFKKSHVYYEPKFDGISVFIYNLLWWLVLISLSVALINMLPVGIFDGGRFFYLTILSLTKNKEIAKKAFVISTKFFIFLLFLLLVFWAISFF